jgi:hypothetical protein
MLVALNMVYTIVMYMWLIVYDKKNLQTLLQNHLYFIGFLNKKDTKWQVSKRSLCQFEFGIVTKVVFFISRMRDYLINHFY